MFCRPHGNIKLRKVFQIKKLNFISFLGSIISSDSCNHFSQILKISYSVYTSISVSFSDKISLSLFTLTVTAESASWQNLSPTSDFVNKPENLLTRTHTTHTEKEKKSSCIFRATIFSWFSKDSKENSEPRNQHRNTY